MKLLNNRFSISSKCYCLLFVASISLVSFLVSTAGPIGSAQVSSSLSYALKQAFAQAAESSEGLVPPLFPSGTQQQGLAQGLQQQQYSAYESPQNNFSVEYPSDWSVREGGRAGVVASFSSSLEDNLDPFAANFAIGVENLTSGTSLDNYTSSIVALLQSQPPAANFSFTGHLISTTFGGLPAQRVGFILTVPSESSSSPETTIVGEQIWTIDDDTAYVLSFASEQNKFASYSPVIEHIIDSFRITRASE